MPEWLIEAWNGIISLGAFLIIAYIITNREIPIWQKLISIPVVIFILAIISVH